MPQRLKKEIELIAEGLHTALKPSALFTDTGKTAIAGYGAKSGNIVILDNLKTPGFFYVSPSLLTVLGYSPRTADIDFATLFHHPDFYKEYSGYLNHFLNHTAGDYESTIKLTCNDGSMLYLYFVSHELSGFSASGRAVITLMAPCAVAAAAPSPKRAKLQSSLEAALEKFYTLEKEKQDTLKYLAKGYTHREIAGKIFRGKDSVEKYVRELKDLFETEQIHDLVDIYRHYIQHKPAEKAVVFYNML